MSFMDSYPNLIPLLRLRFAESSRGVETFEFDRLYGDWSGMVVFRDAKAVVRRSAEQYI